MDGVRTRYRGMAGRETMSGTPHAAASTARRDAYVNTALRERSAYDGAGGYAVNVASKPQLRGPVAMTALLGLGVGVVALRLRAKVRGFVGEAQYSRTHLKGTRDAPSKPVPIHMGQYKQSGSTLLIAGLMAWIGGAAGAAAYYAPVERRKLLLLAANTLITLAAAIALFAVANNTSGTPLAHVGIVDIYAFTAALQALAVYNLYDIARA